MIILDLCSGTGNWSKPYREAGYDVRSFDIKNGQDIRLIERMDNVHGILAGPPCTEFARSGARWWRSKPPEALLEGLGVVDACMRLVWACKPKWWALENPSGRLSRYLGKPAMTFQPCQYGDPYTKLTCLWGDFNKPERNEVEPTEGSKMHKLPDSKGRAALRSATPLGFAYAFWRANP